MSVTPVRILLFALLMVAMTGSIEFLVERMAAAPRVSTGPVSPLHMTGQRSGSGYLITTVQNGAVANEVDAHGNSPSLLTMETAIAVSSTIRTLGGDICSGDCSGNPLYVAEYAHDGTFLGASDITGVPRSSPTQYDYLYDGTTDGTNHYAIGVLTSNVYSLDTNWENPTVLFTLPLPPNGGSWFGITYDTDTGSLWVSTHNATNFIANYELDGTLVSSFFMTTTNGTFIAEGLALDPADDTIWVCRLLASGPSVTRLEQYSKAGVFLGSVSDPAFDNYECLGAEFEIVSTPPCAYAISPESQGFDAVGAAAFVSVTAGAGCSWTAVSHAPWIYLASGGSGSGYGMVLYSVEVNTSPSPRMGTMTIAGRSFTVTQAAASACTTSISPGRVTVLRTGGTGSISVTAGPGCDWTAISQSPWVTITSGAAGAGSGTVTYSVAPLQGRHNRNGRITIAGLTLSITQTR